jgi:ubiquinone biosynthesis monooxygenase Coq7
MLRVDHAGEYGAVRIYEGQIAVLGHTKIGDQLRVRFCCSFFDLNFPS